MSHGRDGELPEEHEEHVNHEAWVIPYADLLTLLMAMFIALFAMSTVDVSKFKAFAIGFNEALGDGKLDAGIGGAGKATSPVVGAGNGNGPFSGGTLAPSDASANETQLAQILSQVANNKAQGSAQPRPSKTCSARSSPPRIISGSAMRSARSSSTTGCRSRC
jgi:chemotaxis protein MotB